MSAVGLGVDVGTDTIKVALVQSKAGKTSLLSYSARSHGKNLASAMRSLMADVNLTQVQGVAVTGRLGAIVDGLSLPSKAALRKGLRTLHPELKSATALSIGAHGFCVLELHENGRDYYCQNARCSQGTGNFLSQLVERFGLSVSEASDLCDAVNDPCALSGRCPVILKTDMTHLANKGEDRTRILAGLFDAVCENVTSLIRTRFAPKDVVLVGGVSRGPRIRRRIGQWLLAREMRLVPSRAEDTAIEAIGAAVYALEDPAARRHLRLVDDLLRRREPSKMERLPALSVAMAKVHRMPAPKFNDEIGNCSVVLGLDIGSTGSKLVAVEVERAIPIWETYLNTEGMPVRAAQRLLALWAQRAANSARIIAFGVTGSGREVVGSLLRTCYGTNRVFVLNEIAAHARGATAVDPTVDTIFEIGGQDAKYIRLEHGRVVDAAMNEACSAGTGSFIAEQGAKFGDTELTARELGCRAMQASHSVSLGQHCSVFMAEVIDEATAAGEDHSATIAGLYDSVVQNYLNRVKGTRTIGNRIFCQGMPFAADALAAAVARQTERDVVVPPNPGTIGALGIALLTLDEHQLDLAATEALAADRFLGASVLAKETIQCRSIKGCGGSGNKCRIDRIVTCVEGVQQKFLWGGSCSLYDRAAARRKLPDRAPDPFLEREAFLDALLSSMALNTEGPSIGLPDEFAFKGLAPLFVAFLQHLGLRCHVLRKADSKTLHRGIEESTGPYCAPMQLINGAYLELFDQQCDYLLLPVFGGLPRVSSEEHSTLCPIVIASSDLINSLFPKSKTKVLRPLIDFDSAGIEGVLFRDCLWELAREVGKLDRFENALKEALFAQNGFESYCFELGTQALRFCRDNDIVPIAVLGRPYTIYNDVLNSNVPSILRQLGAMPIPVDCVPLGDDVPTYFRQYWSHTQRNLRVADKVRRTSSLYSVFCSNYACGPDSFTLHFFAYCMQGKPYAVVETDGHSGDAGTKTRMEAFLYCVDTDRKSQTSIATPCRDFSTIEQRDWSWRQARQRNDVILLPRMGPQAEVAAAALRADGLRAEALPPSTRDDVRTGRQQTSGKECLPMMLTLGTLLNRVRDAQHNETTFSFFMPTACGPCRFGVYNSLHKIVLERLGLDERVRVISPSDADYFEGTRPDFAIRLWIGFLAHDLLQAMRLHVRPVEREAGRAKALYAKYFSLLVQVLEQPGKGTLLAAMGQLSQNMWGIREIITEAAAEFAAAMGEERRVPTVAVVGEIYVRLDPFANDNIVERLESKGLRVQFAPFVEWLEYSNGLSEARILEGRPTSKDRPLTAGFTGLVQRVTTNVLYGICSRALGWPARTSVSEVLASGERFVHRALTGEAVLTVGGPIHEFEKGRIDAVVIVGPHECMPCKIAEGRFARIGETTRLPHLALYLGGDGIDTEAIDRFAFDLHERERIDKVRKIGNIMPNGKESGDSPPPVSGLFGSYSEERRLARE
jgi:activator of 2-hydroxyglutaryl-CoA dehydratase/predicted nucleotide-binding protein (sugar kinase/HSP70/actin superfamily)